MFKLYRTRKEEGSLIWVNLNQIEFFRPGKVGSYDYSGTDIWMKSGARIWVADEPETIVNDLQKGGLL